MQRHVRRAGIVALAWRIVLTTGTGCIFGFLVARQAYDAAIMAPLFVAMSLSLGLAVFILVLTGAASMTARPPRRWPAPAARAPSGALRLGGALLRCGPAPRQPLRGRARHGGAVPARRRRPVSGGVLDRSDPGRHACAARHPVGVAPARSRGWTAAAAALVVVGGLSQLYGIIIGGQAAPLDIFPGKEVVEGALVAGEPASYCGQSSRASPRSRRRGGRGSDTRDRREGAEDPSRPVRRGGRRGRRRRARKLRGRSFGPPFRRRLARVRLMVGPVAFHRMRQAEAIHEQVAAIRAGSAHDFR